MANEQINDKPITTSIIERVTALLNLVVLCCCTTWLGLVGLFEWFMFSVCIVFFDITIVVMINEVLLSKELKKKDLLLRTCPTNQTIICWILF